MTGRTRLPTIGGVVLFAYLLVWMLQLVLLYNSPESFDRAASWWGSLTGRLLACVVLLAAVYHLLEGLRRVVRPGWALSPDGPADDQPEAVLSVPGGTRADRLVALGVPFLTFAVVLPGWAVLLRPWLDGTAG